MKTCTSCLQEKEASDFYKASGRPSLRAHCKDCTRERTRLRTDTDEGRARRAAQARDYRAKNPEMRRRHYLSTYNLTSDRYAEILASQGGVCAVCLVAECATGDSFSVDHDHRCCPSGGSCGKCVRGLLCRSCNVGLGNLGDDPDRLERAARYLRMPL